MKKSIIGLLIIILFLGFSTSLYASQQRPTRPEMKKVIVEVKYIKATWAMGVLRKFMSPQGVITQLPGDNRLIIQDTPEMVDKIVSILKELDVKKKELQFEIELVLGTMKESSTSKELMSDYLIKELRSLLKYKYFKRLDLSLIKVQDNSHSYQRLGGEGMSFSLKLYPTYIQEENKDNFKVELQLSRTILYPGGEEKLIRLISTVLTIKSGDKSVVGVSKLNGGDKALILIIQGKVIK